jgi:hypothetical protein
MTSIVPTRRAWHAVAELVLAGPQHRRTGEIALTAAEGGFATTAEPALHVVGGEVVHAAGSVAINGNTCARIAAAIGIDVGAPAGLYSDGSGVAPDEPLELDLDAAWILGTAFRVGDEALRALAPSERAILWPEHFDLGITVDEVNFGVSPGDGFLGEPYAYVGPWKPREGPFWNAPFGAARAIRELSTVEAILAFFQEGRSRAD